MLDSDEQLARLKLRIAAIDNRFAARKAAAPVQMSPPNWRHARSFIEEWSEGEVVQNDFGAHFQTERLFAANKRHGSADIGALRALPHDLLHVLGAGDVPAVAPERWGFLDTETTGLAGGSGTYAFLIGVGRVSADGFSVRQFFVREYAQEKSTLAALEQYLQQFDVLITYNGKSYDQPLLETRYRMCRQKPPFGRLPHVDLLHGSRRIWKLRMESCRLMQLEEQILGFYREGDLPGDLIPYVYFEYLRSREAQRVVPIFHHNAIDILTLACLTAIVPAAFQNAHPESLASLGVCRGEDLVGIARWLNAAGESEQALTLLRQAVQTGLPDRLLFRTLWDTALLEKKMKRSSAALEILVDLAGCRNEYRVCALEELAKYYEHEERNFALALDFTDQALTIETRPDLVRRRERLQRRLAKTSSRRLI